VVEREIDHPLLLLEVRYLSSEEFSIIDFIEKLNEIGPTNQYAERLYDISVIGKRWRTVYVVSEKGKRADEGLAFKGITQVSVLKSGNPRLL
jgi:hypothetical protein